MSVEVNQRTVAPSSTAAVASDGAGIERLATPDAQASSQGWRDVPRLLWSRLRSSQVGRNATYNLLGWTVFLGSNLVVLPYAVAKLGADIYGVFVLITSVVGVLGLLELGLGDAITVHVSGCLVRGERARVSRLLGTAVSLLAIVGTLVGAGLYLSAPLVTRLLLRSEHAALQSDVVLSLRIAAVGVMITLAISPLGSVPQAVQRYGVYNVITSAFAVLNAILTVVVIALGYGLIGLVVMTVVGVALLGVVQYIVAHKLLHGIPVALTIDGHEAKALLSFGGLIVLNRLAYMTSTHGFRVLIGAFLGGAAVTYFTVAQKVVLAGAGVFASIANVMLPAASALGAAKERDRLSSLLKRSEWVIAALALVPFSVLAAFSHPILSLWMGKEFSVHSWKLLSLMAVAQYLYVLGMPSNRIALGMVGQARMATAVAIAAAIATCAMLVPLHTMMGLEGVGVSMLLGGVIGLATHFLLARALRVRAVAAA